MDAANTELLYRTLHTANQLSIYGAVAGWCEDFSVTSDEKPPKTTNDDVLKEVQPKEVTSLVEAPRNAQPAAGNSLREVQQNFELNAWNCPFQMMKSCQVTKILSPQEQINLLHGSR